MRIVFRVDASFKMGIGHVMRCLSLAEALQNDGVRIEFVCRKHLGNLIDKIRSNGFNVYELELTNKSSIDDKLDNAGLLEVTQKQDAEDCINILGPEKINWLIVDHYAIDEDWQRLMIPYYNNLMVIDDLSDRKHICDLLLDQTYGRKNEDYESLVPKTCQLLLGSKYALLRTDFCKWRRHSLNHKSSSKFTKLLISMGGVDTDNITETILKEISTCRLPSNLEVTVVIGSAYPNIDRLANLASISPYKVKIKIDINNMAEIMANSDIAIGATGSTTWERCCLGLPTIQMVLAKNQKYIAKSLNDINAIVLMENIHNLSKKIEKILKYRAKISLASSSIVDCKGSSNVKNLIFSNSVNSNLSLIPSRLEDIEFLYNLQTNKTRKYFINQDVPSIEQHNIWCKNIINSPVSELFIIIFNDCRVGSLRVDNITNNELEVSIIIKPENSGKGFGRKAINEIENIVPGKLLKATIHKKNIISRRLFIKSGFILRKQSGDFCEYVKNIKYEGLM